jgi:hypothetical protein
MKNEYRRQQHACHLIFIPPGEQTLYTPYIYTRICICILLFIYNRYKIVVFSLLSVSLSLHTRTIHTIYTVSKVLNECHRLTSVTSKVPTYYYNQQIVNNNIDNK